VARVEEAVALALALAIAVVHSIAAGAKTPPLPFPSRHIRHIRHIRRGDSE
jgi:hypothetical protein